MLLCTSFALKRWNIFRCARDKRRTLYIWTSTNFAGTYYTILRHFFLFLLGNCMHYYAPLFMDFPCFGKISLLLVSPSVL